MTTRKAAADARVKLAACEPCREAKVACDHAHPVCRRCRNRSLTDKCIYRETPFKKRKNFTDTTTNSISANSSGQEEYISVEAPISSSSTAIPNTQPNPGFLGSSSYKTIFSHMNSNEALQDLSEQSLQENIQTTASTQVQTNERIIIDGVQLLEDIRKSGIFPAGAQLMHQWFSRGLNVALASPFSESCVQATHDLALKLHTTSLSETSKNLSLASGSLLSNQAGLISFAASFCGKQTRWETLSLCFLLLSRATLDILAPITFGKDEHEQQQFRKKLLGFSDRCLEMALGLDYLNDLQLFVQYENFIAHACIDGDQSYASWRKLGDVTSSLYALGYHEDVTGNPTVPEWLQQMRKGAVARAYSADKNVAIFLGRPPRVDRKFFSSKVLGQIAQDLTIVDISKEIWTLPVLHNPEFSYDLDTWWSAMCARLKEEALDLSRESNRTEKSRRASNIEAHALAQWEALPAKYHLQGNLKNHSSNLQERDFVVSAKLNHLHVLFLVKIAVARFIPEISHQLVSVSASMLSIISEAIMLKSQLQNSGTTLMWKLCYYGLPAAGVLCLYLLDSATIYDDVSRVDALRGLNILVAHISSGAFAGAEDPNFGLLNTAAKAMQAIIEKLLSRGWRNANTVAEERSSPTHDTDILGGSQWLAWTNSDFQDFEIDFWDNIVDHPALC